MSLSKMIGWAIVGLVFIMIIRVIDLPDISVPTNMDWMMPALPILFLIAGFVLIYRKISGGWFIVILGLIALWLGYDNVVDAGKNIGQATTELTRSLNESGPLPTTGEIVPSRTFGDLRVFALADTWRKVKLPPGTEICIDPITAVQKRPDSTSAVMYYRSLARGQTVHVHFYFMPYGHDCVLSPPAPDETARPEAGLNRQAHESERGGFLLSDQLSRDIEPKGSHSNCKDAVSGNHNHHAGDTPENMLFAGTAGSRVPGGHNELKAAPKKNEKGDRHH
jgi:hypothetical protein